MADIAAAAELAALAQLAAAERKRLLEDFNATAVVYPQGRQLVHQLFEAQAANQPQAIALVCGDDSMCYGELNRRANRVAHRLLALGVRPDDRVPICAERGFAMVVGLLGILKAGGAYVPLEPGHPADRLAFMLSDCAAAAVIAQARLADRLSAPLAQQGLPLVVLGDNGSTAAAATDCPEHNPDPAELSLTPRHLAYVLYTSGSTGQPKGAMNQHDGVVNRLLWAQDFYKLEHGERVLQKTPYGFDVSAWEFFLPLHAGAQLVMARPEGHHDPRYLARTVDEAGISTLHFVPSMLSLFLDQVEAGSLPSLRRVICSGEALPHALQMRFLERLPHVELHNQYGPTEAAIDVTHWHCRPGSHAGIVPIGRPIANTRIYILDTKGQPVPIGVCGELHLGGVQVGRGYLNRAELTAERFVCDPFGDKPDARLYKTGDLGRWLHDGSIEYLGRNDFQVKIRGVRIELGEIEAMLAACDGVKEALVLARQYQEDDQRLVAYLVPEEGIRLSAAGLREKLSASLADSMVPSAFVSLPAFPLTANGKLDRNALPAPSLNSMATRPFEAPEGRMEITIACMWQELLGIKKIGRNDHFFDLGGHSLLAVRLASQLRQTLEVEIALHQLFAQPTLARMALTAAQAAGTSMQPIPKADRKQVLALSFAQQRLWFLDQLETGSAFYNIPSATRLVGRLDEAALRRAVNALAARHETLRTTISAVDGTPRQIVAATLEIALPLTDLTALSPAEREAKAQWLIQDEAQMPFDLASGPLIRTGLIRLAPTEHILLATLHHIISDGWSMNLLLQETSVLYAAFLQNRAPPLPVLPVQYADFAQWQRRWLGNELLQQQLAYWKEQLAGAPPLLALPTDRPRPPVQSYCGAKAYFSVSADTASGLAALNRRAQATMFMTVCAAYNVLLARYCGQDDICIGIPIANRSRAEIEPLIGLFVNTLVLRTQVEGAESFDALLQQVRATALDAYAHQDLPFEQLVEALRPERDMSHAPLFQAMLVLQSAPTGRLALPGLRLYPVITDSATSKFDLTLNLTEEEGRLSGFFEYSTDLFERPTVERMAQHFVRLLDAAALDPGMPVRSLPMLSREESRQLLVEWNDTATAYPQGQTLHGLFRAQARKTPHATALVFEGAQLNYAELDRRSDQLARHLHSLGAGPESVVGLYAERSIEMVVGLLGILKSGAAYLPLDPSHPQDRVAYMVEDAGPAAILAQGHLQESLPGNAAAVFCLDAEWQLPARHDDDGLADTLADNAQPHNLAYVIYTSGSSGRPKGVAIEHAAIINRLQWMQEEYVLTPADRVLQKTPFSFDVSVWEFFWPLAQGATLVLARPGGHQDPAYLASLIARQAITTLHFVPPMLDAFLEALQLAGTAWHCASLRQVMCSGQALPLELQQRFFAQLPCVALHNLYGPTEAAVDVTSWRCREDASLISVPIGRPIANIQATILDAYLNPVPPGVAGELHIAGVGLARGYLNRPDLTAEKFVPNPFGTAPGARMYKSGDLARHLRDGNIDCLGRIDHQVKIRGFRIEPGEIEAALSAQPEVREAIVLARADIEGGRRPADLRLAAYVVPAAGQTVSIEALRGALLQTLPDHMVPAHFIVLDRLPLTSNGKVDRAALPAPTALRNADFIEPSTPTEKTLASIWSQVLKLDSIGVTDNFFDLGGHSLLATQVVSKIHAALQIDVAVRTLFEAPSIAQLADRIDAEIESLDEFEL